MLKRPLSLLTIAALCTGFLSVIVPAHPVSALSCAPPEEGIIGRIKKVEFHAKGQSTDAITITLEQAYKIGLEFTDVTSDGSTDIRVYDRVVSEFLENPSAFTVATDVSVSRTKDEEVYYIDNTIDLDAFYPGDEQWRNMNVKAGDVIVRGPMEDYCAKNGDNLIYDADGDLKYALHLDLGRYEFSDSPLILTEGAMSRCDHERKNWIDQGEPITCDIDVKVSYNQESGIATPAHPFRLESGVVDAVHLMHSYRVRRGSTLYRMQNGESYARILIVANSASSLQGATPEPLEEYIPLDPNEIDEEFFLDVRKTHTDFEAIFDLKRRDIFRGTDDGSNYFEPTKDLNRAELMAIVMRMLRAQAPYTVKTDNCFSDVEKEAWFHDDICIAAAEGIISGYPDGKFRPERSVNKAEAMKIIMNAVINTYGIDASVNAEAGADWFAPYVSYARSWNLLDAERMNMRLDARLTRADAAHLLYNALRKGIEQTGEEY